MKKLSILLFATLMMTCGGLFAQSYTNPLTLLFNNDSTLNSNDV